MSDTLILKIDLWCWCLLIKSSINFRCAHETDSQIDFYFILLTVTAVGLIPGSLFLWKFVTKVWAAWPWDHTLPQFLALWAGGDFLGPLDIEVAVCRFSLDDKQFWKWQLIVIGIVMAELLLICCVPVMCSTAILQHGTVQCYSRSFGSNGRVVGVSWDHNFTWMPNVIGIWGILRCCQHFKVFVTFPWYFLPGLLSSFCGIEACTPYLRNPTVITVCRWHLGVCLFFKGVRFISVKG